MKSSPVLDAAPQVEILRACSCGARWDLGQIHALARPPVSAAMERLHDGEDHDPEDPKGEGPWRDVEPEEMGAIGRGGRGAAPVDLEAAEPLLEGRRAGRGLTRRRHARAVLHTVGGPRR